MNFFNKTAFLFLALLLPVSLVALPQSAIAAFFDTEGHVFQESIEFLAQRDIVNGYTNGNFEPDHPLNRAEMMKILMEYHAEISEDIPGYCFNDVKNEWYAPYVCQGKIQGVVEGYSDGSFSPEKEVNMPEALKMAFGSYGIQIETDDENWYEGYVEFAHNHSLFSKHSYLPSRSMTRGEMSFLIHQLILNEEGVKPLDSYSNYLSVGCGTPPPSAPSTSMVNGVERSYITVIPDDYDENTPKKLIFAFHGRTNSNSDVRGYYKVEQAAGNEAIIVYPSGLPTSSSPRNWADLGDGPSELRDYAFFDQLLEDFSNQYCIDLDEVYVVGHSLGAWFTNSLACHRGHVIRGVGTLGGGTSVGECTGPVATMIWHNPNDRLAPFKSGEQARDQYIRQNQCSQATTPVAPSAGNCLEYQGCYGDAPLVWCPHTMNSDGRGKYYPHNWPKITGPEIWSFFKSLE